MNEEGWSFVRLQSELHAIMVPLFCSAYTVFSLIHSSETVVVLLCAYAYQPYILKRSLYSPYSKGIQLSHIARLVYNFFRNIKCFSRACLMFKMFFQDNIFKTTTRTSFIIIKINSPFLLSYFKLISYEA